MVTKNENLARITEVIGALEGSCVDSYQLCQFFRAITAEVFTLNFDEFGRWLYGVAESYLSDNQMSEAKIWMDNQGYYTGGVEKTFTVTMQCRDDFIALDVLEFLETNMNGWKNIEVRED